MKTTQAFRALSLGRARRRLADILDRVEVRLLGRKIAADRIQAEIIEPIGEIKSADTRRFVVDAHLTRVRFYLASRANAVPEAATAYLAAGEADRAEGGSFERAADLAEIGRTLIDALERLNSRRRAMRVFVVHAAALEVAGTRRGDLDDLFRIAPPIAARAVLAGLAGEVATLTKSLARLHAADSTLDEAVRERRRDVLFRLSVLAKEDEGTLRFRPPPGAMGADEAEAVVGAVIRTRPLDDEALEFVTTTLPTTPSALTALATAARRWMKVRAQVGPDEVDRYERANLWARGVWPGEGWPIQNLVRLFARRRDATDAVALFAGLMDRGLKPGALPYLVGPILFRLGFSHTAARIGGPILALLARAEELLANAPGAEVLENFMGGVERVLAEERVPASLRAATLRIQGKLLAATGRFDDAGRVLERALARDDRSPTVAVDLAEVLAAKGDVTRAAAFVEVAEESLSSPRLGEVKAAVLERRGRPGEAARALALALDQTADDVPAVPACAGVLAALSDAYARHWQADPAGSAFLAELQAEAKLVAPRFERTLSRPDVLRRRALILADRGGEAAIAEKLAEPWRSRWAGEPWLAGIVARARLRRGDAAGAIEVAESCTSPDGRLRLVRGVACWKLGRLDDARQVLLVDGAPPDAASAIAVATMYVSAGRDADALAIVRQVADSDSAPPDARARLLAFEATLLEKNGRGLEALAAYVRSLELDESVAARRAYARLAVALGLAQGPGAALGRDLLEKALNAVDLVPEARDPAWTAMAEAALHRPSAPAGPELAELLVSQARRSPPGSLERRRVGMWMRWLEDAGDWRGALKLASGAPDLVGGEAPAAVIDRVVLRRLTDSTGGGSLDEDLGAALRVRTDPAGHALAYVWAALRGEPATAPRPAPSLPLEIRRAVLWLAVLRGERPAADEHAVAFDDLDAGTSTEAAIARAVAAGEVTESIAALVESAAAAECALPFGPAAARAAALRRRVLGAWPLLLRELPGLDRVSMVSTLVLALRALVAARDAESTAARQRDINESLQHAATIPDLARAIEAALAAPEGGGVVP